MSLGQAIRQRRRALGLSQEEVAARAAVSPRTLRGIEAGQVAHPRRETVRRLTAALGLDGESLHRGLRLAVLGPLEVTRGGVPVDLRSRKQRRLLGLLAIRPNQAVSLAEIAETLWGAAERPAKWQGLVHTYVWRVRRAVGPEAVVGRTRGGYTLNVDTAALDLARFDDLIQRAPACEDGGERLALLSRALDLWRGPVLADLPPPAPSLRAVVEAITERRTTAALRLADEGLERADFDRVVSALRPLVAANPLHEGLHARLMPALAGQGRQADALELFTRVRDRLKEELGTDPSPELARAHLRVLRQDLPAPAGSSASAHEPSGAVEPSGVSESPGVGESRGVGEGARAHVVPAELPADVAGFAGRASQLVRLHDLLTSGRAPVTAISGPGGIGKSALAVHVAWRLTGHFPDGQLYVDLRDTTPDVEPIDPHDALGRFLRSLGIDDVPRDLEEAAARYRSVTRGRRLLILLDNAADAAQVRPLLPGGPSCGVIVTSRRTLIGLNAAHERLGVLPETGATDLLRNLLGDARVDAEPDAVHALVRLCAGLPLALRIAAARLATRTTWTVRTIVERLRQRPLDRFHAGDLSLAATFRTSYDALDAAHARAFRLCALPAGPDIGIPAAAAVLGLRDEQAGELLENLVDLNLLESSVPGRYHYHDLLRLFARDRAGQEDPPVRRAAAVNVTASGRERPGYVSGRAPWVGSCEPDGHSLRT